MRDYVNKNLNIIEKHLKKRTKKLSKLNRISLINEFKEWREPIFNKELVWTLPDLTRIERFKNFCRSIKKEIH